MAFQTGIEGKPWYYGVAVGLLLGAVVVGIGYWWKLKPAKEEIARLEAQQKQLDAKITEGLSAEARLPQLKESIKLKQQELDKLLQILPARYETQTILRNIRSLAEQGDFRLRVFEPSTKFIEKDFYKEWPISIQLDGTYHNLAIFFDKIRIFPRLFNIENLKINALKKGPYTLATSFTAKTFVQIEPDSASLAKEEAAKKAPPARPKRGPA